jgi:hypothetical protein
LASLVLYVAGYRPSAVEPVDASAAQPVAGTFQRHHADVITLKGASYRLKNSGITGTTLTAPQNTAQYSYNESGLHFNERNRPTFQRASSHDHTQAPSCTPIAALKVDLVGVNKASSTKVICSSGEHEILAGPGLMVRHHALANSPNPR